MAGTYADQAALWEAIDSFTRACGGDTSNATISDARMRAVSAVEAVVGRLRSRVPLVPPTETGQKPLWQVKVACTDLEGERVVSTQYVHVSAEHVAEAAAIQRVKDAGVRSIDAVLRIQRGRYLTDEEVDALLCTCGATFEPCPLHATKEALAVDLLKVANELRIDPCHCRQTFGLPAGEPLVHGPGCVFKAEAEKP